MGDRVAELKFTDPEGAVDDFPIRHTLHERTIRDGRAVPALGGPLLVCTKTDDVLMNNNKSSWGVCSAGGAPPR